LEQLLLVAPVLVSELEVGVVGGGAHGGEVDDVSDGVGMCQCEEEVCDERVAGATCESGVDEENGVYALESGLH